MPNASTYKTSGERMLAVGGGGGGKTSAFLTLPGKKFIYLFEPNALSTLQGHDIDYELFVPTELNLNAVALKAGVADTFGKPPKDGPKTYVDFEKDFEDRLHSGGFDGYDTIGFDSMSTFQDIVMDRILWLNGRSGKWPEQADWTATMNTIKNVMRTFTGMQGKNIYVTAHIEYKQEQDSGKMMNVLNLIGRLRNSLPLLFSDIWQFYGDRDKGGNTRYYVQTQQDRYSPYLRCTLRGINATEDVTIENWLNPEKYGVGRLMQQASD